MASEEKSQKSEKEGAKVSVQAEASERTILRPYPKVVFFYLTFISALVCGIFTSLRPDTKEFWTYLFLWVFTFNLLVVSFDFSRMLSVAVFFLALAFVFLGLWVGFLQKILWFLKGIHPAADAPFFFFVFFLFLVVYVLVFIQTRFNYWVVRKNELLHKHGFLADVKRYPAQDMKIDKEITDVFEFLLLRSGSMILYPEGENRAIVLENVIAINRKEKEIKQILESYSIRVEHV